MYLLLYVQLVGIKYKITCLLHGTCIIMCLQVGRECIVAVATIPSYISFLDAEFGRVWKEALVEYFNVLGQHLLGLTVKSHRLPFSANEPPTYETWGPITLHCYLFPLWKFKLWVACHTVRKNLKDFCLFSSQHTLCRRSCLMA